MTEYVLRRFELAGIEITQEQAQKICDVATNIALVGSGFWLDELINFLISQHYRPAVELAEMVNNG